MASSSHTHIFYKYAEELTLAELQKLRDIINDPSNKGLSLAITDHGAPGKGFVKMSTYAMKLIKTCSSFLPENNEDVEIFYGESSGGADESSLWGDTTLEILSNSSHTTYETIIGSETLLSHLLHSVYGWDEYVKWCLGHDFMPLEDFVNELNAFDFDTVIESKILAREASGAALTAAETKILVKARAAAKAAVQVDLKDAIYEMERKLAEMRSQLTALDSDREA